MADPIEKTVATLGEEGSDDPISEAQGTHGDFDPEIPIESAQETVEAESTEERLNRMFEVPETDENPEATQSEDHAYMRSITFVAGKDEVDPDPNDTFERAEDAKERLQEIEMVNEEMKAYDSPRRYIINRNDAPDDAYVYEDEFGKYYYEAFEDPIRPSHVAKYAGVEAWPLLNEDEQVLKTVELFNGLSGEPLADADTKEAALSWFKRHAVLPTDDVGDDVFDLNILERIAKTVAVATVAKKGNRKGRVYVDSPADAPEGVDVEEGQEGGYYYDTGGGDGDGGVDLSGATFEDELSNFQAEFEGSTGRSLDEADEGEIREGLEWFAQEHMGVPPDGVEETVDHMEAELRDAGWTPADSGDGDGEDVDDGGGGGGGGPDNPDLSGAAFEDEIESFMSTFEQETGRGVEESSKEELREYVEGYVDTYLDGTREDADIMLEELIEGIGGEENLMF